jgi:hypothetical protein
MKSRSKKIKMADIIPQLWLLQTEHLFIGYHHQGLIEQEPKHHEMATYFVAWEIQYEKQLQRLLSLILRIPLGVGITFTMINMALLAFHEVREIQILPMIIQDILLTERPNSTVASPPTLLMSFIYST